MNPKVSVIIPTYNRAAKARNAIDSVLNQTFHDLEIIVVDDGSSDDTERILGDAYGARIRYFAQANQGVSAARNKGLAEARGEWIAFLDSDDLWENDKLEWQFRALERFGPRCGACYTDVRVFNHPETRTLFQMAQATYCHEGTMGISPHVLRLLIKPGGAGMVVCVCSVLARADAVRKTGGFDSNLRHGEDSEFLLRLAMVTGVCFVNRPLISVDRAPSRIRHVGPSADWDEPQYVLRHIQLRLEGFLRLGEHLPEDIRKVARQELGSVFSGLANCHLEAGHYGSSQNDASKAVRLNPTLKIAAKWLLIRISPKLALTAVRRHRRTNKPQDFM